MIVSGNKNLMNFTVIKRFGKRLDLKNRFGSDAYAAEELIALSGQSAPCLTLH